MKVLGLDVGSSSVGGALIDLDDCVVERAFARVFPEGVDRDQQGGEQSKSQTRRTARGMRRQISRRVRRKQLLRQALQQVGLLPNSADELTAVLAANPYHLRQKGVSEKLEQHELGRVLFHLATRRGFLSNRKPDKARDTKGMLEEIGELQQRLEDREETLGQFLSSKLKQHDHSAEDHSRPVRGRHTQRSMYEAEFEAIWNKQRDFYPKVLTDQLKYGRTGKQEFPTKPSGRRRGLSLVDRFGLHGLIFFQRSMYWPKSMIGRCELEPKKKRCPKANRLAQLFRILQEVNNLKVLDAKVSDADGQRPLSSEERATIVAALLSTRQQTFSALRKKLKFTENMTFNTERGGCDKLKGHETDAILSGKNGVGKRWKELDEVIKDQIVDVCLHETREDVAIQRLMEFRLTEDEAERAAAVHLPDGHVHFCRDAIERLIPHLQDGKFLMAEDESNSALHAAGYLRPDERVIDEQEFLPPPPEVPNPIVRQALFEVRKVVNAIIREHGKPDAIHIELAREAKKSFDERQEIRFDNIRRQKKREAIADRLREEYGIKPTRNNVNRYLLWQDQEGDCLYCGNKISQAQLFNGDADIDHILPRWRSLDDSLGNKVVAHRSCNQDKKDRTPREWLEASDRPRYEQMLQLAKKLDYGKRQRLQQMDIQLENFVERQLRDTTYISRCVKQYLECLGKPVVCPRGNMTADLRHWWGLNNILDKTQRGRKNRNDHRHHAVDAIVVALTDQARLFALANAKGENMPAPWPGFSQAARMAVLGINVSHKVQRQLRGALHEATIYGPTQKNGDTTEEERPWAKGWVEDESTYVRRKPVTEINNAKHLAKVRDKAIREALAQHLIEQDVDPWGKKAYPSQAFKSNEDPEKDNTPRMQSGVPIKKVRMLEESETFRAVSKDRPGQSTKPGNNHHIVYWARGEGVKERWSADVVTMWDAARRARSGTATPTIDRTPPKEGMRFVMSLSIGEMFEMVGDDGEIGLFVVRKIDQRSKRLYFKRHNDARSAGEVEKDNLYCSPKKMLERSTRKVTIDPLGRIRWAND